MLITLGNYLMIINCNNRDMRRPISLEDELLHQISVIDCILMRLRLTRPHSWRNNFKLCTNYRSMDYIGFSKFLRIQLLVP